MAAVRRLVAQLAVALARDLALVHHKIAGDELHSYDSVKDGVDVA